MQYNTVSDHYEKHLYGYSSKRIVMGRNTFEGIGTLGVKNVGPPSFGAFGSGTQVYREGSKDQPMLTDNQAFPPRYMSRPSSMMEIDLNTPPHMIGRTETPQNFTTSPLAEDFKVEIIKPETTTASYTQLADKVKHESVQAASSVGYKQPVMPGSYPSDTLTSSRTSRLEARKLKASGGKSPYSRPTTSKPIIKQDPYDAAITGALLDRVKRLEQPKRKNLNQIGGEKKSARIGEQTNSLKRGTDSSQGGSRKKQNTNVGANNKKRKGGVLLSKVQKSQKLSQALSVNTSGKSKTGPKATKKTGIKIDSLIPTRISSRNVKK